MQVPYGHLVRRGVLAMRDSTVPAFPQDIPAPIVKLHELFEEMPQWGIAAMALTFLAGILLIASVRYTLQGVMTTLAMVESPQTTVIVRDEKSKFDHADALAEEAIDSEVLIIKQVPITARIRTTIQHLQSRGGFAARWRGLSALVVWMTGLTLIKHLLFNLLMPIVGYGHPEQVGLMVVKPLVSIAAQVLLARLGLTWTHIVISEPSSKPWYRRIPSRKAWKQIRGPTKYTAIAWQLNFIIPLAVAYALGLTEGPQVLENQSPHCVAMKVLAVGAIALVTFVGITIPAKVALTRVQASLLPEEDESIVPYDRTFGGAVVPEILGGSGKLGYLQAWKTFDGGARVRLLKLYVKIFAVDVALHVLLLLTLAVEFVAIVGPKAYDLLDQLTRSAPTDNFDMAQARYEAVTLGS